jgi:hypothetical protein
MIAFYSVSGEEEDVKFAHIVIFGVPSALAALTAKRFLRQWKNRIEIGCI